MADIRNSTGNGLKNGRGGKWENAALLGALGLDLGLDIESPPLSKLRAGLVFERPFTKPVIGAIREGYGR
jgi:hypothetical protein